MSVRDRRGRIPIVAALGGSVTLLGAAILFFVMQSVVPIRADGRDRAPSAQLAVCSGNTDGLLYPLDATWTLTLPSCDDCSSAATPLGFVFDLYGDTYSEAFVNNNGNISFGAALGPFFRTGFPDATFSTVAAFYADGDTRENPDPGIPADVYQKSVDGNGDGTPDTFVVTWRNVGYYQRHFDRRNTYQLAVSDGTNPTMGLGNNVCFSYDVMCWTTGDVDQGVGGFGPVPAVVGVNRGDGVDSLEIGRFNHDGADYAGPGPGPDPGGIHYLDQQRFCFSTATTNGNVCPIAAGFPRGEVVLHPLEPFSHVLRLLSPEQGQTTTVTVEDTAGAQSVGLAVANTPGTMATVGLSWTPTCGSLGAYPLVFHATDDFSSPCTTDAGFTLVVSCDDGDPCTTDTCDPSAGCVHTGGVSCDDGNPCTDDSCDNQTGCRHAPNTASCDDGNPCTSGDRCSGGACVSGNALSCDDGNPCTDDSCDSQTGCRHAPNTAPCDDGDPRTSGDRCVNGACVGQGTGGCDDGNPCTDDHAGSSGGCVHTYNTAPCDDGNPCTTRDTCNHGRCVGGRPASCNDRDPCTRDSCNPQSGCVHDPASDSDGDGVCDRLDACDSSILTPTVVVGSCDSGVPNRRLPFGCTIADRLAACGGSPLHPGSRSRSRSSGECVERTLELLRHLRVISRAEERAILRCYGGR